MASLVPTLSNLTNLQVSRYLSLASYALLVYDLVLTLPKEISLVWPARWSIVKTLFLINRYTVPVVITLNLVGIIGLTPSLSVTVIVRVLLQAAARLTYDVLSDISCQDVIMLLVFWQVTSLFIGDIIVALRIHALLHRSQRAFVALSVLLVTSYTSVYTLVGIIAMDTFPTIVYLESFGLCFANPPHLLWAAWLPGAVFSGIITSITFYRLWRHMSREGMPFREALDSDGAIYIFISFLSRLFEVLIWAFAPISLSLLAEHFAFAITTAVYSRLLLNLPGVETRTQWTQAMSVIGSTSKRMTPNLWLVDQGGFSFLEQVYQRSVSPDDKTKFNYVDDVITLS